MYDSNLKAKWDYENSIAYAEEKGIKKGIEKGKELGRREDSLEIARKMKEDGIPVAQIAKFTSLSIEEIEKLR